MNTSANYRALVNRVIVRVYAQQGGLLMTKATGHALADELIKEIGDVAEHKGRCLVPGLGIVHRSTSKPRRIMNPITKESMMLPARWSLKMRPAKNRKGVVHVRPAVGE